MTQFLSRVGAFPRSLFAQRWLSWLVTVLVVGGVGAVLLPVLRYYPEGVHAYFASAEQWQRHLVIFAASIGLVLILFNLLSPRLPHLRVIFRHPPMWSACAVAVVLLCVADLSLGLGPPDFRATRWEWALYGGGSVFLVMIHRWIFSTNESKQTSPEEATEVSVEELVRDWPKFEQWLRNERPADEDLIGNRGVARRLADYLVTRDGAIGLVGPFGSGKSSVVNWLKDDVERIRKSDHPKVLFCEQSCWGFEDSTSAIQQILTRAIEEVRKHADCFSIGSLPESYRKTFSAGGDWLRNVADLVFGSVNPMQQFKQMAEILSALNAKLVVIIEDLDRNNSSRFDRQEILALLQRLRGVSDRLSFVLTSGQTSARDIDFAKLCDHIEILREFDADRVISLARAVRNRCLESFPHVQTASGNDDPWNPVHYWLLSRYDILPLPTAVARLLRTPRALKHALRRTYQAWEVLYGEVDFDHLLAVNILRHGAPEAFDFLIRHWGQLQDDPQQWHSDRDQLQGLRARLRQEWKQVTRKVEWDTRAALEILVFLLPATGDYVRDRRGTNRGRIQGIGHNRYWIRIVNEEIDSAHARDQMVLRDLQQWVTTRDPSAPLVGGLCRCEDYAGVWERLAPVVFGHDQDVILTFAEQILARFRTPQGTQRSGHDPHPAFLAVWRCAHRMARHDDESRDWLERQIRLAMLISLSLVNDLYYYWASRRFGIVRFEDRARLRRLVCERAREQFRHGNDLIRVIHPVMPYGVYQLVFPPDTDDGPSECRGVEHWSWLGPILVDALRQEPQVFTRQISHLISDRKHGEHGVTVYSRDAQLLTGFFGDSASEVIRLIAEERDRTEDGDRGFLDQLVRSAEPFLRSAADKEPS